MIINETGIIEQINKYCLGPFINHPNPNNSPNIISFPFDFTSKFPIHLR